MLEFRWLIAGKVDLQKIPDPKDIPFVFKEYHCLETGLTPEYLDINLVPPPANHFLHLIRTPFKFWIGETNVPVNVLDHNNEQTRQWYRRYLQKTYYFLEQFGRIALTDDNQDYTIYHNVCDLVPIFVRKKGDYLYRAGIMLSPDKAYGLE